MSSAKQQILAALEQMAVTTMAMPDIAVEGAPVNLVAQYTEMLTKVGGVAIEANGVEQVQRYLDDKMAAGEQVLSTVAGIDGNRQLDGDAHQLHDLDLALVRAEFAVAENGAVYIVTDGFKHRVLPFIAENLAAVLSKQQIVATMHQAVSQPQLATSASGCFIAGPSKTADIEQALVIGAHGACSMTVFLID